MSKVESFYWKKLSSKSFSFESDQFFDLCFVLAVHGGSTDNTQYIPLLCCKTKGMFQESKVEMSKVESLYWNKLSFKSFSFELEKFSNLCFVLAFHWDSTDNFQYIPLLCCKTKGIFQKS